jgi:phosphomannomutase
MAQLIISISGIRGIVGDGLGPREAVRFGLAFGSTLERGLVVLGRDSRPSGPMLAAAFKAGLLAAGCRVADAGILSTPGIALAVRTQRAAGGAVLTASHNPSPYNGIKMLSPEGHAVTADAGRTVVDLYEREAFTETAADAVGVEVLCPDAAAAHARLVAGLVDADRIRAAGLTVAIDATNGAGGREMMLLMDALGCRAAPINLEPTGVFGRGPEPVPENLADLGRTVRDSGAAVGLALDPDADRLALVDETGRAIGEEYTLALACRHRLTQKRGPLAANLSTSRMMDDVALEAGVPLFRTPVGEVNVALAIGRHGCVLGGEGNGGVIDPRVVPVRDSLVGAALVLEMLATRRVTLSLLAAELPPYAMVKDKATLASATPDAVIRAVRQAFPDARADDRDGLHLAWDAGWLHVRASNTEPILRIIAEADQPDTARAWVDQVKALAAKSG